MNYLIWSRLYYSKIGIKNIDSIFVYFSDTCTYLNMSGFLHLYSVFVIW